MQHSFTWKQFSAIAGLSLWQFYFRLFPGAIRSEQVIEFLGALRRQIERPLLIIWDGVATHRSRRLKAWLEEQDGEIAVARLPPYAPELNPVEAIWASLKKHEIANLCLAPLAQSASLPTTGSSRGAGREFLFVAIDDHARIGFTDLHADESKASAVQFLENTVAYFRALGVRGRRVLTDNGAAFRSKAFAKVCRRLGIKHGFTRPYRPQTNGKAEHFIQSALREWAYGVPYHHSSERAAMLERWIHHYNWHRPHQGIGGLAPLSRLRMSGNNLLTLHT